MISMGHLWLIFFLTVSSAKMTYCKKISFFFERILVLFVSILVNLENIYGPYCNPKNSYRPDAGLVRYAGFV